MLITGETESSSRLTTHTTDRVSVSSGVTSDYDADSLTTLSTLRDSSMSALTLVSVDGRSAVPPTGRPVAAKMTGGVDQSVRLAAHTVSLSCSTTSLSLPALPRPSPVLFNCLYFILINLDLMFCCVLLPLLPLSEQRRYCVAHRLSVTLSRCECAICQAATARTSHESVAR